MATNCIADCGFFANAPSAYCSACARLGVEQRYAARRMTRAACARERAHAVEARAAAAAAAVARADAVSYEVLRASRARPGADAEAAHRLAAARRCAAQVASPRALMQTLDNTLLTAAEAAPLLAIVGQRNSSFVHPVLCRVVDAHGAHMHDWQHFWVCYHDMATGASHEHLPRTAEDVRASLARRFGFAQSAAAFYVSHVMAGRE